jgi:hypothetical protein
MKMNSGSKFGTIQVFEGFRVRLVYSEIQIIIPAQHLGLDPAPRPGPTSLT